MLHILVKEGGWTTFSVYEPAVGGKFADLYITVDSMLAEVPEKGGEYGVVVRRDDKDYYQFLISHNGYYKIRMHEGEEWTTLVDWIKSDAINQGINNMNRLQVFCYGSDLRFYVNGVFMEQIEDTSFSSGQIGLLVGSYKDGPRVYAVFDNVAVYEVD